MTLIDHVWHTNRQTKITFGTQIDKQKVSKSAQSLTQFYFHLNIKSDTVLETDRFSQEGKCHQEHVQNRSSNITLKRNWK